MKRKFLKREMHRHRRNLQNGEADTYHGKRHQRLMDHHPYFVKNHPHFLMHMKRQKQLRRVRRAMILMPGMMVTLIILIGAVIYKWIGHENFAVLIAGMFVFLIVLGILQAFSFKRISKRILEPIMSLRVGFDIVGEGDYSVRMEPDDFADMNGLMHAFNDMAQKLEHSEQIKSEYEENRKLLIANISHDLKTPMTTVQGYLEVMEEGVVKDPEKMMKYVQVMRKNTEYMNKLIDDLFMYAKLDIDQVQFEFNEVNAKDFFDDMLEELAVAMTDNAFEFTYLNQVNPHIHMQADGKKLHRAFLNIVSNSAKYGRDLSHPKLHVSLTSGPETITLLFRDFGPGIPEDKLENIFDRFYRIDDERTKDLESTGLGLAITRELILAHNGQIKAHNHPEGGAVFTIQLPASNSGEHAIKENGGAK